MWNHVENHDQPWLTVKFWRALFSDKPTLGMTINLTSSSASIVGKGRSYPSTIHGSSHALDRPVAPGHIVISWAAPSSGSPSSATRHSSHHLSETCWPWTVMVAGRKWWHEIVGAYFPWSFKSLNLGLGCGLREFLLGVPAKQGCIQALGLCLVQSIHCAQGVIHSAIHTRELPCDVEMFAGKILVDLKRSALPRRHVECWTSPLNPKQAKNFQTWECHTYCSCQFAPSKQQPVGFHMFPSAEDRRMAWHLLSCRQTFLQIRGILVTWPPHFHTPVMGHGSTIKGWLESMNSSHLAYSSIIWYPPPHPPYTNCHFPSKWE